MKMNQEYFNDKVKNGFNDTKFSDIDQEDLFNKTQKGAIAEFFDDKILKERIKAGRA